MLYFHMGFSMDGINFASLQVRIEGRGQKSRAIAGPKFFEAFLLYLAAEVASAKGGVAGVQLIDQVRVLIDLAVSLIG